MLPHIGGEEKSIARAFAACHLGVANLDVESIEDHEARRLLGTLERLMNTDDIHDSTGEGANYDRALAMAQEERAEFSKAVDYLASWFCMQFWSS